MSEKNIEQQRLLALYSRIYKVLEHRFFSSEHILYDYIGLKGEIIMPHPDECLSGQPNAFGWNTPIENGAFFNGDLLTGLTVIYKKSPSEEIKTRMRTLLEGLFYLQDLSPVPGCILRGLSSDGKTAYPASSNDQVIPFLLALWSYSQSSAATEAERTECLNRCRRLCAALEKNNWIIPGIQPGFERGNILANAPFDNCHALLCAIILDEFENGRNTRFSTIFNERKDNYAVGYPIINAIECWYSSHNFYLMRLAAEIHPECKETFASGLKATATAAAKHLSEWKKYNPGLLFSPDWHALNRVWHEQKNSKDGDDVARKQWSLWTAASPAVMNERVTFMVSLTAAWIVLISGDETLISETRAGIIQMLESIPYESLYYSPFFFAVNVIAEML